MGGWLASICEAEVKDNNESVRFSIEFEVLAEPNAAG